MINCIIGYLQCILMMDNMPGNKLNRPENIPQSFLLDDARELLSGMQKIEGGKKRFFFDIK